MTFAKLISTIFSGQLQSQSNAGTLGGTMKYINLGGIKMLWGTATVAAGSLTNGNNLTVVFPTSFFSSIQTAHANFLNLVSTAQQESHWNPISTTGGTITVGNNGTPGGSQIVGYTVIGA